MTHKNWISIFVLLSIILFTSCNNDKLQRSRELSKKKAVDKRLTESPHYSYYAPKNLNNIEGILAILDPHSRPQLVMDSLHSFADSNNLVLLGLDEIRNGIRDYDAIISRDVEHLKNLKALGNTKLYFLGFSGGARMANFYAAQHRIDGLIMCGAGIKRQSKLPFPTVLMAGTKDFNFREQYYNQYSPKVYDANSMAIHFRGKHQWPQVKLIKYSIKFILHRQTGGDEKLASFFEKNSEKLFSNKRYYLSFKSMEAAYKMSSLENNNERKMLLEKLAKNPRIKNYFKRSDLYLEEETARFETYANSIDIKDITWWNNELKYIRNKSEKRDVISADSYARTLAYLGIVMYSKLNQAVAGRGRTDLIPKYLQLYEMIDANNPDLYFFKAVYQYARGNDNNAIIAIQKAKELGFVDVERMNGFFAQDFINKF